MIYCTDFKKKYLGHLDGIDEIKINYGKDNKDVIPFLKKMVGKTVILNIKEPIDFKLIKEINNNDEYANIKLCFSMYETSLIDEAKEKEIPFFFSDNIYSFDLLNMACAAGVTDVYITEELGFFMEDVHEKCAEAGVRVRVYPDVAQSSCASSSANKKFFIRPDDVFVYEPYIDVLEFYDTSKNQAILYQVYKKGYWYGNLDEIIVNAPSIDNRAFNQFFAARRLNCGKKCSRKNICRSCDWYEIIRANSH